LSQSSAAPSRPKRKAIDRPIPRDEAVTIATFPVNDEIMLALYDRFGFDRIVERHDYAEMPPKVDYAFTEYGKSLKPVLKMLCNWGEEHLKQMDVVGETK
jgi:HxlR-like helix-turn-helix